MPACFHLLRDKPPSMPFSTVLLAVSVRIQNVYLFISVYYLYIVCIDIHIEVPAVPPEEIAGRPEGEPSATIRARVSAARALQHRRQGKPNTQLTSREVGQYATPDDQGELLLKQAISRLGCPHAAITAS